jgi:hypothetical protein
LGTLQTAHIQASIAVAEKEVSPLLFVIDGRLHLSMTDSLRSKTEVLLLPQNPNGNKSGPLWSRPKRCIKSVAKLYPLPRLGAVLSAQFHEMMGMYVDAFGKAAWETLENKLGLEEDTEGFRELLKTEAN